MAVDDCICRGVNLKDLDVERAVQLLKWPLLLGEHDALKQPVLLHHGKFGYYVQVGHTNAPLPKVSPTGS